MKKFTPGFQLNKEFYTDIVGPLMQEHFPDLFYSAGLVGHGSDVAGFDSPKSMDHNWGPHLHMFFSESDFVIYRNRVDEMLKNYLPHTYKGYSTSFVNGSNQYLESVPDEEQHGEVKHLFEFWTPRSFFIHYMGFDIQKEPSYRDWLLFPQQSLFEVTGGALFHDQLEVQKLRDTFEYYPDDIWKYMLRVQWGKILDELQMQARNGEEGDEVGAMVVTARTVQKIMMLCFLMERKYAPYSKWFGTAFQRLKCAEKMYPLILEILHTKDWQKRQKLLAHAYQKLGKIHNKLGITKPLTTELIDFFGRGYEIIDLWEYVREIEKVIENEQLRNMKYPLGSVDQFIDHARINHMDYFYTELKEVIR